MAFFKLSALAFQITKQLKSTNCLSYKKTGFWTTHYTMTLWSNEADLKASAKSGAHFSSMKQSKSIAKEIRTITIEADTLPSWKEAKKLLVNGSVYRFG